MNYSEFLADEAATLAFGKRCAILFSAPFVVYLDGNLGAGKTTFVRGLLRGLGFSGAVKSPTYAIVESYALPNLSVQHFDLYRFASPEEWEDAGLDDLIANSLCLIEWADKGGDYVPRPDFIIQLNKEDNGRQINILPQNTCASEGLTIWQI